jgi:putative colanic acid biosynthesis glycosyltransferase
MSSIGWVMTIQNTDEGTAGAVHREDDCDRGIAEGSALPRPRPAEFLAPAVKFSIVTVVLNNKEGLERTAQSIVMQRDAAFEWIVIDGGSTDGTLDVISSYGGFISYWQSQEDNGIFDAMNEGLSRATADYILFLNSGDRFASDDSLKIVAQSVAQLARMPAMILAGAFYEYPHGHRMIQQPRKVEGYIQHSNPVSHQATFLSRRLHQQIPYDTSYRIASDYDLICRVFLRDGSCSYVNNVLVVAQRGGSSHSSRQPWTHVRECARVQRKILHTGYGSILRSSIKRLMVYVAENLMSRKRLAPATWAIIRTFRPTVD